MRGCIPLSYIDSRKQIAQLRLDDRGVFRVLTILQDRDELTQSVWPINRAPTFLAVSFCFLFAFLLLTSFFASSS